MTEIFEKLIEASRHGKAVCFCVVIETNGAVPRHAGSKMLVYSDGTTFGSVGGGGVEDQTIAAALNSLKNGKPQILHYSLNAREKNAVGICGGDVTVYIEPQMAQPVLLVLERGMLANRSLNLLSYWILG